MARHFLTGEELTAAEQSRLLDRAIELKADRLSSRALQGRSVALVFDKPSTRTRVSFDVGVHELGGHPVVLRQGELLLGRKLRACQEVVCHASPQLESLPRA